ncbi:protein of unknown function [Gracilibacillus ureilyticus]|uniref:DUF3899 domain-containing protein n=1 Tax=Gracilibacillus ureilyticus TaxID=531814 RepID=A0A1H9SPQ5_9BACI|nr:DUF3899 domain-containing protein [Gracilibacillus ureilyticus]SER86755.1 protein of unknown function [Gracilibacillus ureilyticus]
MKKQFLFFFVQCLVCLIFLLLLKKDISIIDFINITFYLSGIYLVSGLLLFVISKGFFDITVNSFRKVFTRTDKKKQWEETWQDNGAPSDKVNPDWILFFLLQGGLMFLLMGILLVIYYN